MPPIRLPLDKSDSLTVHAYPLTPDSFRPFGSVIQNPHPSVPPAPTLPNNLAHDPVPANQGTAIKYQHLSAPLDLYASAPSKVPSKPVLNLFSCASRPLRHRAPPTVVPPPISTLLPYNSTSTAAAHRGTGVFQVAILERHPFTTQTFVPLAPPPGCAYLVVVAPSLPPSHLDEGLPCPASSSSSAPGTTTPGRGLPDMRGLRAFIASPGQGVTYGAGTWHAPMVALGPPGASVDFSVTQFANGVADEDCQEVVFGGRDGEGEVVVEVPERIGVSRL